jgi:hypothetical protein
MAGFEATTFGDRANLFFFRRSLLLLILRNPIQFGQGLGKLADWRGNCPVDADKSRVTLHLE